MDSDSSSQEHTSTECTTDSSDDDEKLETAQIGGVRLQLPQGLCERDEIFTEFFSATTWNSLSQVQKLHLKNFLPKFPENDGQEKNITLQKLFNQEKFRFNSPLMEFHERLKAGHYRPDIARMRLMIKKAERKEAKYRHKRHRERLKSDVNESRRSLLGLIKSLPPGIEPKMERLSPSVSSYVNPISFRTKRRYFQELTGIREKLEETGFSSDENYPEGPPTPLSRKQRRHLNSIKTPPNGEKCILSTMVTKPAGLDLERLVTPNNNPFSLTEESYRKLLLVHKRRRLENYNDPDLNTSSITISDIIQRTQLPYVKKSNSSSTPKHHNNESKPSKKKIKREPLEVPRAHTPDMIKSNPFFGHSSNSELDSDSDSLLESFNRKLPLTNKIKTKRIKTEIKTESLGNFSASSASNEATPDPPLPKSINSLSQYGKITPATLSDLDGIDMMNIPIDLDDSHIDILELNNKPELMQETHSNFLSLLRDIICSTNEHRMDLRNLEERLKSWQENPISPLNDWYCLTDNWVLVLRSAINFLSGNFSEQPEDFVPYMEYKPQAEVYQWIGAGRDSDGLLSPLCQYWLEHRNEMKPALPSQEEKEELDIEISDRSQTPPPPRCPTSWTVRKADSDDVKTFQEQERRRYDSPHKAYTYRCNGYESVVGPVKGIYSNQNLGVTKARGHSMLSADRPNFVTILTLVRDATARLPNGEGTRAEICELLKCSQYIQDNGPDNILQSVVSGALDRMHTQFDPCVKYDPKRKVWIYLHRNRSEDDFERIHQQYQGMNKSIKKPVAKIKSPAKSKAKVKTSNKTTGESQMVTEKIKTEATTSAVPGANVDISGSNLEIKTTSQSLPKSGKSLLLCNKLTNKSEGVTENHALTQEPQKPVPILRKPPAKPRPVPPLTRPEKPLPETLPVLTQVRESSIPKATSTGKIGKGLMKVISPQQTKAPPIATVSSQLLKQVEHRNTATKQLTSSQTVTQSVTQQFLQTIAAQQKQLLLQKHNASPSEKMLESKTQVKVPVSVQQQYLQSIPSQQLQNIKTITLLRSVTPTPAGSPVLGAPVTLASKIESLDSHVVTNISNQTGVHNAVQEQVVQAVPQKRPAQQTLTPAQQQQILQTLRQKVLPIQQTVLSSQHQAILKQKAAVQVQKQAQAAVASSLLGQTKDGILTKPIITTSQTPLLAKVLTNSAGQVISVESLLAHQRQHGSLPQGTTLRISNSKTGQPNIIQLAAPSSQNPGAQFAVARQNSIVTLANQPKLVITSPVTSLVTSTVTVTKPSVKPSAKTQTVTKFSPKVAQHLVNTKFITQNLAGQKIVQPKVLVGGQQNQIKIPISTKSMGISKAVSLNITSNTNTIRMVNAANFNIAQIGGKPVLLASKGNSVHNIQGQNIILQTTQTGTTGPGVILTNAGKTITNPNISQQPSTVNMNLTNQNTQMLVSPQLKLQQAQPVVLSSTMKPTSSMGQSQNQTVTQNQIMLGGHPVRLQTTGTGNTTHRVVLASQSQGQIVTQQILLPVGFQGTPLNIKALQGLKVVPIAQSQQGRGFQGRQVFARVMNPANLVRAAQSQHTEPTTTTAE